MSGVLSAAQYWAGTPLQTTALALYDRVNWPWMQQASGVFYGAWTPESGFSGGYGDFSEAAAVPPGPGLADVSIVRCILVFLVAHAG